MQMKTEKDMYGFLRSAEYIELERESRLAIAPAIVKRDLAWVHYLKAIGGAVNLKPGGVFKPSYQLKMLVRRGVPAAYRSLVWKHISMSDQYRLRHPRSYYSDLVDRINEDLNAKVRDDIDKDLLRTFPDHDYFRSGCGLATLCRVLSAYALHNPEVAYCQSLNFIAGTLLLYLEEEDGFWLFCALLDYILPAEQYSRSM
ncbi:TBC1D9, partial [Symbiodinium microadriaticum]